MSFMKRESYNLNNSNTASAGEQRESVPSQGISGNYSADHTELGSLPTLVTPQPFSMNRKMEYKSVQSTSSSRTASNASSSETTSRYQQFRQNQMEADANRQPPPPVPRKPSQPGDATSPNPRDEVSGPFPPASSGSGPRTPSSAPLQAEWGFVRPPSEMEDTFNKALKIMEFGGELNPAGVQQYFDQVKQQMSDFTRDQSQTMPTRMESSMSSQMSSSYNEQTMGGNLHNWKPQPAQRLFQSANPVQTYRTVPATQGFGSPRDPIPTVLMPQAMQQPQRRPHEMAVDSPPLVKMYEASVLNGPLQEFLNLSAQIGGDCAESANLVKQAFDVQRNFLWKSAGCPKPSDADLPALLAPTSEKIQAIQEGKNAKRQSPHFNHLSAISEGIPALGWVAVAPTPCPFINEMKDASQFYTNRVLKEFKEKDKKHVEWVKAWLGVLNELHAYVKQNHTTGLVWNTAPGSTPPSGGAAAGGGPAPPGGPPPPPPPPPADLFAGLDKGAQPPQDDGRGALFAEINQGMDITRSLKKVSDDQKTHKNPTLRAAGTVPDKKPALAPKPAALTNGAAPAAKRATPPPVCELQGGKKWIVEFQKSNPSVMIVPENMKQVVYVYKCENSVVQIKGKINSITIDSCKKTSVVFDDIVAGVEVINCQSVQVQTLAKLPMLSIQKTDGCQVYLSKESLDAEIVSSKSSEMNILVPDPSGEFKEHVVPEQFKTVWTGKGLDTTVVELG